MKRNKVWFSFGVVTAIGVLVLLITRFESGFTNPNDGTKVPVGIWKIEDLKAISDEASSDNGVAQLGYSENAKVAQIDVLHDDVFQLTFMETDSFSVFTDANSDERYILSHDANLFTRWDDIYIDGANGVLVGVDRDTQEKVYYLVTIFSPDFDSDSSQIVFSIRNQTNNEVPAELLDLIPVDFLRKQLQLFVSVDLFDASLIIESIELPEL